MSSVPANVERGVEWLEREFGEGWEEEIDLNKLDLSSTCNCVLGQLTGNYDDALDDMGIARPDRYGFTTHGRQTFARLTGAWATVIAGRRTG